MGNIQSRMIAYALVASISSTASAATTERLSIVSNGEVVGSLVAVTGGDRASIDYRVDNNGRGPKNHADVVLGPGGVPIAWNVTGTSLMGGAVAERFAWANGRANWSSQADKGESAAARPQVYILNDDNPWALGGYARAALAAPDHAIDVLPSGRLMLTSVRTLAVGTGKAATPVTIYRLDGTQLDPDYVALDNAGRLFATLGLSTTVRTGYEAEVPALQVLAQSLETERIKAISAKVAHRYAVPVRIRDVHLFDARTGRLGPLSTVVVMRDRIAQVLPGDGGRPPADEAVVEGEGGTLYPGLHDMHSHTTMTSGLFYLAAGVTTTRDMGNDNAFLQDLMPRIEAGEIAGPRIVPDGFIEGRSPFSARYGFVIDNLEDGLKAVRWYADRGYFQIKIYNSMNPDFVKPLAAAAHELGLGVTGHVPAFDTPDRVIADGYDTIAHINQLMLGWLLDPSEDTRTPLRLTAMARAADLDLAAPRVRHTVALMKQHHVALDTTTVILERLMLSRAGATAAGDVDYLDHTPIGYQRYRKRTFVPLKDAAEDQRYVKAFDKIVDVMRMLHKEGIQMLPGTDDVTGFTAQREVALYARVMGPGDALKAATLDSDVYLHHDAEAGTIERGKFADLVLVAGDPTKDITAITRPRMVMKGGAIYYPSEIYTALSIRPLATPPTMRQPAVAAALPSRPPVGMFGHEGD